MTSRNYSVEKTDNYVEIGEIVEMLANWVVREIEKQQMMNCLDKELRKVLNCSANEYKKDEERIKNKVRQTIS